MKKIIITGYVGNNPELRSDQSGSEFVTYSVGIPVGTKDNPKTDWVNVSCNGKLAEITKAYVKKGDKILIEGYPTAGVYINHENKPVPTLNVYANHLESLNRKSLDKNEVKPKDEDEYLTNSSSEQEAF